MTNKLIISVCFLLLAAAKGSKAGDFPDLQFEHITVKNGLSSNAVSSIAQDQQGFIWVGTSNGLNRYDGYRFKHYYHSNTDSNSLINNDVQRLYCDSKGRIWISTEDGAGCFIPSENRFINFSSRFKTPYKLKNNSSVGVYEDAHGTIWLCNQANVIYRVREDITLEEIKINIPAFSFYNQTILGYSNIFRDKSGGEWAYNANRIYQLDSSTRQPVKTFQFSAQINGFILKMTQDNEDNFFVTSFGSGAWQFLPAENRLKKMGDLPSRIISDVTPWKYRGQQWMACMEVNWGLYIFDTSYSASRKYGFIPADPSSLHGNNFNQLFVDKKGNLWITSNYGINKVSVEQKIFDIIPATEPGTINYQFDKATTVYSFFEQGRNTWLSKRGISTFEFDSLFRLKNVYTSLSPLSSSKVSGNGWAYFFYQKGDELYITTDSGFVVYDLINKTAKAYLPEKLAVAPDLRTIVPLNEKELMIRSFSNGLFIFNTSEKKFTRRFVSADLCSECLPLRMNYLFKTRKNEIFLSTGSGGKGLFKYEPASGTFNAVKPVNDDRFAMLSSDLYGMDEDRNGNLWITSKSGLFVYDPVSSTILKQNNDNEQIGSLSRICFDNNGNAWVNGSSGIWCYLAGKEKWISFTGEDGLPGSHFEGILSKRKNGDIVAGLEGAVAVFHPDRLKAIQNDHTVVITEAAVENKLVPFPLTNGGSKTMTLRPGQTSFSVDFAILNYSNPASSRYYYKLSPLMKEFRLNDNGHINFNGLVPGTYTLEVKTGDKAGNVFDTTDLLEIRVQPRWYQTTGFRIVCGLLLAACILYVVKRRIATIRKEASLKQRIAETEMQALRAQMNPHFLFNSLNSIENFIMQNEKRLASDYLNKFSRLIRSILDSSLDEMVPVSKDMEVLKLYTDLEQLRFSNKFSCYIHTDPRLMQGDYAVPSLLIQPYVENAIVHGIAHSQEEKLEVKVTASLEGDHIRYTIEDNGIGRAKAGAYNRRNKPGHKSVGLQITADRIAHFNPGADKTKAVTVTDLYNDRNEPCGTKVEVLLKVE